ncbi:hypothetical protein Tco_1304652 [Tanacetum coccineum]
MCERHEVNYIHSEELNNDVRNDLEDFKRCIHSMRTDQWKLFAKDDSKTTSVLPKKKSKSINQEPQSKTDFEKLMTKFLDDQRVSSMFIKNNINDMILKMKQNEKNFQTIFKNMERKLDEWEKSQNISPEQTYWTEPQPPPQAPTEQMNAVFTGSGKSDDPSKTQKDPPLSIIVNNKIKKVKPTKTSKRDYQVVKTNQYPFHEPTQGILDVTAGGIFLYKSPNQAFQLLQDKVLFKLDWSNKSQNDHHRKSVSFADGSNNDNSRFMEN